MPAMSEEEWVEVMSSPDARFFVTLGSFVTRWNFCEVRLLNIWLQWHTDAAAFLKLKNEQRTAAIRRCLREREGEYGPDVSALLPNALDAYDRVCDNRNVAAHSLTTFARGQAPIVRRGPRWKEPLVPEIGLTVDVLVHNLAAASELDTRLWLINVFLEEGNLSSRQTDLLPMGIPPPIVPQPKD